MEPDWKNTTGEDTLEAPNVTRVDGRELLAPGSQPIVANRMILQTFTNTFKAEETTQPQKLATDGSRASVAVDENAISQGEIYREEFEKMKFYRDQKQICLNPKGIDTCEHNFLQRLEGKLQFPLFAKIQDGVLKFQEEYMDEKMLEALTKYIEEDFQSERPTAKSKLVQHLIIDGGNFKDNDFATILQAVMKHKKLTSVSYSNNEFGAESIAALEKAF